MITNLYQIDILRWTKVYVPAASEEEAKKLVKLYHGFVEIAEQLEDGPPVVKLIRDDYSDGRP